jgi:hypothetical protein
MRRQHKALSREQCYLFWLRRYLGAAGHASSTSSEKKLETFLSDLARDRHVSASTQNQALTPLCFLP